MSEVFTASNGVQVYRNEMNDLTMYSPGGECDWLLVAHENALREFFMHERDKDLGRWRDPVNLDRVVYALNEDQIFVVDEGAGHKEPWVRDEANNENNVYWPDFDTARRYFDAHPERKPWHDAKPGEVWVLIIDGKERPLQVVEFGGVSRFCMSLGSRPTYMETGSPQITAGRRIWPESDGE